jgi:Type II CAAX prenyl endopeptidase Rce1-like
MRLKASVTAVTEHRGVQGLLALALAVPLVATVGQYWASGFWRQSTGVLILFWPSVDWRWMVQMNAAIAMGAIGVLYVAGITHLLRARTLTAVMLAGAGGLIVAQLAGAAVNHFTGWRELEPLGSFDFTGRVNRFIFAQWHNPLWEELVFRGLPLLGYVWLVKRKPAAAKWCYFIVPALAMAAYHVPGHGYSRIVDTFLLSVVFAWLALRYSLWSVIVLHCVFDAVSVLSLGHGRGVSPDEVRWLADCFGALNSTFTLSMMAAIGMAAIIAFANYHTSRLTRSAGAS